jgi:probable HAF family extracellular repeat protein
MRRKALAIALGIATALLAAGVAGAAPPRYALIDVNKQDPIVTCLSDGLPEHHGPSIATAINASGVATGGYLYCDDGSYGAYLDSITNGWQGSYTGGFGPGIPPSESAFDWWGYAINDAGSIAGSSGFYPVLSFTPPAGAWVFINGISIHIPTFAHTLTLDEWSEALAIDNANNAVGTSITDSGSYHAFKWSSGVLKDLGVPPGFTDSVATGINNGRIVGVVSNGGPCGRIMDVLPPSGACAAGRAFVYTDNTFKLLQIFDGRPSEANAVNAAGVIVGSVVTRTGATHAFSWSAGVPRDLGTLPGATSSSALGINSSGDIVGTSGGRAFLYRGGVMYDLNAVISAPSDLTLIAARGINTAGQIAGWATGPGVFQLGTVNHGFLLNPK